MKMKFTLKRLLTLVVVGLIAVAASAQTLPANWNFQVTSTNAIYLVQPTASIKIDGVQIVNGDYIGAFYTSSTGMKCAGYMMYTGTTNNVTVWEDDNLTPLPNKEGFANGEFVSWRIYDMSAATEYEAAYVVYNPFLAPGTNFAGNSMSGIDTLHAYSSLDLKPVSLVSPTTSCGLSATSTVSIKVTNIADGDVTGPFDFSYSLDNGASWATSTYTSGVVSGDTVVCTFSQTADLSAFVNVGGVDSDSTYQFIFAVSFVDDVDLSNDTATATVTNMVPPNVSFSGLPAELCDYSIAPITLTGFPAGGTYSSTGNPLIVQGSVFLPNMAGVGHHEIIYSYNDAATGCVGTSQGSIDIHAAPEINLAGYGATPEICQYESVDINCVGIGGGQLTADFFGTYVSPSTGVFSPLTPGNFDIYCSYTDTNGCYDESPVVTFTVHALPVASFVNLERAYCTNGSLVTVTGNPAGGGFFIDGISTSGSNQFDPTQLTAGVHNLSYVYTDLNGCVDTVAKTIKLFNPPVVSLDGLESEYCRYDQADTLIGTPANGVWSGAINTNIFNPTTVGNFNITYTYSHLNIGYTDTVFCTSFDDASTIVRALPAIDIASGHTLTAQGNIETCDPTVIELNAGPGLTSYEWNTGDTIQKITTTDGYGGYTVTVTNMFGCEGTDSLFIGGTNVELIDQISPLSNCTLSGSEPLILRYTNVATKVFAPTDKIRFIGQYGNNNIVNSFDSRTTPFAPGDTLTFEFPSLPPGTAGLGVIGEYDLLAYLHYDNQGGTLPDCMLSNDTLETTIIHAGLPVADLPLTIETNSPDSVVLNPGEFNTYQWNTGATTQTITDLTFGGAPYVVTVTDEYGCTDIDSLIYIVDIDELPTSFESMNIYPNPNSGLFTLYVQNKVYTSISYELVDARGRVIATRQEKSTRELKEQIDIKDQAKGIYFLKVFNGKDYAINKIIVQ